MARDASTTRAIVAMMVGVSLCVLLMLVIGGLGSGGNELASDSANDLSVPLEGVVFELGGAASRAELIADEGPILLPDVASGDLDIWLQHLGDEAYVGWYVFAVRPDAVTDRSCFAAWQEDNETFVDTCTGAVHLTDGRPAEDTATTDALTQFEVTIHNGGLLVNLQDDFTGEPGLNRITGTTPD